MSGTLNQYCLNSTDTTGRNNVEAFWYFGARRAYGRCRCGTKLDSGLRGTWKGESETVVVGAGNTHHPGAAAEEPEFRSVGFSLTIDEQEGRRFSGIFSSARSSYRVVAVISRSGTIFLADVEGYSSATMLAPDRMELCYLKHTREARVASCTELIKQR